MNTLKNVEQSYQVGSTKYLLHLLRQTIWRWAKLSGQAIQQIPTKEWFQAPMGIRGEAGLSLIDTAREAISLGTTLMLGRMTTDDLDMWTT